MELVAVWVRGAQKKDLLLGGQVLCAPLKQALAHVSFTIDSILSLGDFHSRARRLGNPRACFGQSTQLCAQHRA